MKIFENLLKNKKEKKYANTIILFVVDKLKPWVVFNCLQRENYIITDKQAEELSLIIIKQAISFNIFDKVLKSIGVII